MGVTSNYSFPVPVATDLVKDGWDAINDLGVAVDTAMNTALGTKKAGMVLISTTTIGSAVSSVTIPNVFSATYDNYKVMWNFGDATNTVTGPTYLRMAAASTPNTSATYYRRTAISGDAALANSIESGVTYMYVGSMDTGETSWSGWQLDFYSPFKAKPTVFNLLSFSYEGQLQSHIGGGLHTTSTSYDGFQWYLGSGTVTGGTISVYGYND
jgi:hypothetical protein